MSEFKSRHAFGSEANIDQAIADGKVDAYDILFLDEGKIGWIDRDGNKVVLEDQAGLDEAVVDEKVTAAIEGANSYTDDKVHVTEKIKYEVSHKPVGTIVNYFDREVRIMCPVSTAWALQQSGENADPNCYYIGFKAYAPSDEVVSFKEDLSEVITDSTMYYFEDNDFAGVDAYGRKYSIVWFPVAVNSNGEWTYYGSMSTAEKYIGWYYSVEWYNADGVVVASDCIRINLSNEDCHTSSEPYYVNNVITTANAYTDKQIEEKLAEVSSGFEVIEF